MFEVIRISGNTPDTKDNEPALFLIADSLKGPVIATYSESLGGYWTRPDMTRAKLRKHLKTMAAEGFTIETILKEG